MSVEIYSDVRSVLANVIGKRIVDVTRNDIGDEEGIFISLMLEDGNFIKFYCNKGFQLHFHPTAPPVRIEED